MPRSSQVFYEICDAAPGGYWEPLGFMYDSKSQAENELRVKRKDVPTAFLVRVVMTKCDAGGRERSLKAI